MEREKFKAKESVDRKGKRARKDRALKTEQVQYLVLRYSLLRILPWLRLEIALTVTAPVCVLSAAGSSPVEHFTSHKGSNSQILTRELGLPGARPIPK